MDTIIVLDFGSQTSQLIVRRVREGSMYAVLLPWNTPENKAMGYKPIGFILSGGPSSIYDEDAPRIPDYVLGSGLPILGICYGMQALVHQLGGSVVGATNREFGRSILQNTSKNSLSLFNGQQVWMSHGDKISDLPNGFTTIATTSNSLFAVIGNRKLNMYGVQFHPEVQHTENGKDILASFAINICEAKENWTASSIIRSSIDGIHSKVGDASVLAGVSGGVDSSVATALAQNAIGNQLSAVFIDNGLLRKGEPDFVRNTLKKYLGVDLHFIDASSVFLTALSGISDPERKRSIVGEKFIRVFEQKAIELGSPKFLVQGTIYPDVIESFSKDRGLSRKIKTHHNVGGLPDDMDFELIEPLRYLFKDEVRAIGTELGLPEELLWRQPFPGPGLAVRCLGEITQFRLEKLRNADAILIEELTKTGYINRLPETGLISASQAFAVLLPVQSVGVMGDKRTYDEVLAIRSVSTDDFMTAEWTRIPYDILSVISTRIVNEVAGINRVVYDITNKPPATIEWE